METNYEFEKYVCSKETLKQTIDTYGVAIIPSILTESECKNMVDKIWDFFEHITQKWETPINRMKKILGLNFINYILYIRC